MKVTATKAEGHRKMVRPSNSTYDFSPNSRKMGFGWSWQFGRIPSIFFAFFRVALGLKRSVKDPFNRYITATDTSGGVETQNIDAASRLTPVTGETGEA